MEEQSGKFLYGTRHACVTLVRSVSLRRAERLNLKGDIISTKYRRLLHCFLLVLRLFVIGRKLQRDLKRSPRYALNVAYYRLNWRSSSVAFGLHLLDILRRREVLAQLLQLLICLATPKVARCVTETLALATHHSAGGRAVP